MMLGIVTLAMATKVHVAEAGVVMIGQPPDYHEKTVIAQIAQAVFSGFPVAFYVVSFTTGLILVLACNTAFSGFPVLGSILAQDRYLPRQLHTRGDRLAFSNGIVFLAVVAIILIIVFQADVTALIQLYIVGVFVSFTCSQAGMIRHWKRLIDRETDPAARAQLRRRQAISAVGFVMTGTVLVDRADHQVPLRRLDHHRGDGLHLRRDGRRSASTTTGWPARSPPTRTISCCPAGCTPSCWCPRCTCRRCARWPTPGPPGRTSWRR